MPLPSDAPSQSHPPAVLLEAILESAVDYAILTMDLKGVITSWSLGAEKVLGWPAEAVIGQPADLIYTPQQRAENRLRKEQEEALTVGKAADEDWHLRHDGTHFWALGQMMPLKSESGDTVGFLKILRDRTRQRLERQALHTSEQRLRAVVEAFPGVVWHCNAAGELMGEQPGWAALTGQRFDEYQCYGWADAVDPQDRDALLSAWHQAVDSQQRYFAEAHLRRADGTWGLYSFHASPRLDEEGVLREWVGMSTEITHHRLAQESLVRKTRRLEILNRIGGRLAAELDLERLVQETTDAAVALTGAQFGAFFYNVTDEAGEQYRLYSLSGAAKDAFAHLPMPRITAVFGDTFRGERVVRSDDITLDQRYGQSGPYKGMPRGHLPVRSYLAVPVVSRSGEVHGGLLFGHGQPGQFDAEHEELVLGLAGLAAVAIDNAQLFRSTQFEIRQRKQAEELARKRAARLELLSEVIEGAPLARDLSELIGIVAGAARRLTGADGVSVVLPGQELCHVTPEMAPQFACGGRSFALAECVADWAMSAGETIVIPDVEQEPRLTKDLCRPNLARSLIVVPVLAEDQAIAAVGAYWSNPRTADSEEVSTLEALARTAAAVIKRLEAENALRQLNETLERQVAERTADRDRMWRLSTDMMLLARFNGEITAVNPAWTNNLGWRESDLIGRSLLDFVHPEDLPLTLGEVEGLADGRTTLRFENRYRTRHGDYRWLSWIAVPEQGLIHAVGRDVTAEKEQAQALRQAEEALRQAQKMDAIGQLTGGIAHDFNNLLTGIIGSLDLMQTRIGQGRVESLGRYALAAMNSANRAASLTHRLLAFARRQPLDPKVVDVNRLVLSMEELVRRTLGETIRIEMVTAGGLWPTRCDPHQLESALLNLAINARDAMSDGGTLTIETCNTHLDQAYAAVNRQVTPGQYVCIAVTDTGGGMPPEIRERAFEPFFTTKAIGQGTGLGLSMIYGFAQQSEGHAQIYSELGQGTTVKLYLPRSWGTVEQDGPPDALAQLLHAEVGETVLVVEDEPVVRELVVEVLSDLGYHALKAADGLSGLAVLESDSRIDLLVTDLGLPGMNGQQLAEQARRVRPELKILFITGYAKNATIASGFMQPGMEMITKPFAVDVLAARIRDIMD
ncbi:PAS domain S-box protein [Stutzerimonas tarimensis]|uniref:histidine kinase n=1 Tax=Stutzerimonas tarimensis TaxID=1507735 RepID=A0ABV7T505_9GAMM